MTPDEQRIFAVEAIIASVDDAMRKVDAMGRELQLIRRQLFESASKLKAIRDA